MDQNRLEYLFSRYTAGTATQEEITEFSVLTQQPAHEAYLKAQITQLLLTAGGEAAMPEKTVRATIQHITGKPERAAVVRAIRNRWWAAAAILLLLGGSMYFFKNRTATPLAEKMPGTGKAVLTLADGSRLVLDSSGHQVISQGGTAIRQAGSGLQYAVQHPSGEISYNTLSTPRGGQFKVVLPDGTAVWLNTSSSLRYPTAFSGADRTVELQGEAYFEVAANATQPFHVKTSWQDVQVLGTHFNVNAYTNETHTTTTLLEGRVRVSLPAGNTASVLQPGQQALVPNQANARQITVTTGNADAIAWKNGLFLFDNASLETVMRCLERWYDVDIKYEATPDIHYTGQINNNQPLSKVIIMLEQTGSARFRLARNGAKEMIVVLKQ